jgi:hypothetical protein
MKNSTMWLVVFGGIIAVASVIALVSAFSGSSDKGNDVDLEALTEAYAKYAGTGSDDLKVFEARVNKSDIYTGKEPIKVLMDEQGTVIGYKDLDPAQGIQPKDTVVFRLDAEKETQNVVAQDNSHRYYRRHSPGLFTSVMMMHMLTSQRRHYGGGYYRAPSSAIWQKSGYHRSSTFGRSVRSGSSGTRRPMGGGFGSGK